MSAANPLGRTIVIPVRDRAGRPLPGATVSFTVNGKPAGTAKNTNAGGLIQLSDRQAVVTVSASYHGETMGPITLAQNADHYTFQFDIDVGGPFMERHVPLAVGVVLLLIALALAFTFGTPNPLQTRLILATASLGGGAIATEIPGMLQVNMSFGQKLVIGATGAIAVFAILYLVVPTT
jgi:hypothetical protein